MMKQLINFKYTIEEKRMNVFKHLSISMAIATVFSVLYLYTPALHDEMPWWVKEKMENINHKRASSQTAIISQYTKKHPNYKMKEGNLKRKRADNFENSRN